MNPQQIFDKVTTHLRAQGVSARASASAGCQYIVPGTNLMCAVGCLLSRDDARRIDNAGTVIDVRAGFPDIYAKLDPNNQHVGFLRTLQVAHDLGMPRTKGESLADWEDRMHEIAVANKLTYNPQGSAA